jgi:hypothetical protein
VPPVMRAFGCSGVWSTTASRKLSGRVPAERSVGVLGDQLDPMDETTGSEEADADLAEAAAETATSTATTSAVTSLIELPRVHVSGIIASTSREDENT